MVAPHPVCPELEAAGITGAVAYRVALNTEFRGLHWRDGLLLRGGAGWGEFSPFWEYDDVESGPWLQSAVEAATRPWPEVVRERVEINAIVPACGPGRAVELVEGYRTAKVKVAQAGQVLADDLERVEAVRGALGSGGRIRIDVNGAWSAEEAIAAIPRLERAAGGLEYVEQPCATAEDLARVRRAVDVPIVADESIRRAADPLRVAALGAADAVVVKVAPLGGVRACLDLAERIGLPVVVSSAVESSIGIHAGLRLAASLPRLPFACGLATLDLFTEDVVAKPLRPERGSLRATGSPPEPLAGAGALDARGELTRRWMERAQAVAQKAVLG